MAGKAHTPEQILGTLRDELRNGAIFSTRGEAQVLVEQWRMCCRLGAEQVHRKEKHP